MEQYSNILKQMESLLAEKLLETNGLVCKQLQVADGVYPLYLAKPHWTNRFDSKRESTIGIFCCIWVSPDLLEQGQFSYNIHSKELRKLTGYKLASRKFANDFRTLVRSRVAAWPGIRLDFGPLTLLEGRETCDLENFAEKIEERIAGFVDIHQHIDELLADSLR